MATPSKHIASLDHFLFVIPLFLFLFSFGIRLGYYHLDPLIARDGIIYILSLEHVANFGDQAFSEQEISHIPPLFLLIVRSIMNERISSMAALLAVNLFCGASIPVLIYWLVFFLDFDRFVAFCLGFIASVFPVLVVNSTQLLRESLFLFFILCSIVLAVYAFKKKLFNYCLCGVFSAFFATGGCFIRTEACVPFCIISVCWLIFSFRYKRLHAGIASWSFGLAGMMLLLLLNYPPSRMFLFLTERMTGVLQ